MSLILDAIKQADRERRIGQLPGMTVAHIMNKESAPHPMRWLWLCSALVVLGTVLLLVLRTAPAPQTIGRTPEPPVDIAPTTPSPRIASPQTPFTGPGHPSPTSARNAAPTRRVRQGNTITPTGGTTVLRAKSGELSAPRRDKKLSPSLSQLPPDIQGSLRELEINAHVYDDDPAKRFIFINQHHYRAGDRIGGDGFLLKEITPDGIVIDYGNGQACLKTKNLSLW